MIQRLQQSGVIVTIATGRMHASAVQLAQELGIDVPIVSYNGAMIKKGLSGQLLYLSLIHISSLPRGQVRRGSCGLLTVIGKEVTGEIIYL